MKRLVLVIILLWPVMSYGKLGYSGNQMMVFCDGTFKGEPKENSIIAAVCIGYLRGIWGATDVWQETGLLNPKLVCVPQDVTVEQLRRVFLNYMHQNPGAWGRSVEPHVVIAIKEAWPCKE